VRVLKGFRIRLEDFSVQETDQKEIKFNTIRYGAEVRERKDLCTSKLPWESSRVK